MNAAELLRNARQRAGMSQTDLARAAGITRGLVCRYENGHVEPSAAQLDRLLEPLGLELSVTRRIDTAPDRIAVRLGELIDEYPNLEDRSPGDWGVHDRTGRRLSRDEYLARRAANRERYERWLASATSDSDAS